MFWLVDLFGQLIDYEAYQCGGLSEMEDADEADYHLSSSLLPTGAMLCCVVLCWLVFGP